MFRQRPGFAQLFFFDTDAAARAEARLSHFQENSGIHRDRRLSLEILQMLEQVIIDNNEHYRTFSTAV